MRLADKLGGRQERACEGVGDGRVGFVGEGDLARGGHGYGLRHVGSVSGLEGRLSSLYKAE
jgi:hypothetical protein